ncbi:type II secretion system minor pseudopilin GspI [Alkalilimnicola ehrlichii]|nr:type II secretion system minor pseudopilin GspI [Alkalilimnicola ehrlichii]
MIKRQAPSQSRGFTLVEVLVAVIVVGTALAAIIKVSAESGYNLNYLRDRTFAQWVANDRLVEMQAMEYWGSGRDSGRREMAGREWHWETEISNSPIPRMRQVTVRVYEHEGSEHPLTVLDGLLLDPAVREGQLQ